MHTGLERSATINQDLACFNCGYNLRGLAQSGACPECGKSIDESLREPGTTTPLSDLRHCRQVIVLLTTGAFLAVTAGMLVFGNSTRSWRWIGAPLQLLVWVFVLAAQFKIGRGWARSPLARGVAWCSFGVAVACAAGLTHRAAIASQVQFVATPEDHLLTVANAAAIFPTCAIGLLLGRVLRRLVVIAWSLRVIHVTAAVAAAALLYSARDEFRRIGRLENTIAAAPVPGLGFPQLSWVTIDMVLRPKLGTPTSQIIVLGAVLTTTYSSILGYLICWYGLKIELQRARALAEKVAAN